MLLCIGQKYLLKELRRELEQVTSLSQQLQSQLAGFDRRTRNFNCSLSAELQSSSQNDTAAASPRMTSNHSPDVLIEFSPSRARGASEIAAPARTSSQPSTPSYFSDDDSIPRHLSFSDVDAADDIGETYEYSDEFNDSRGSGDSRPAADSGSESGDSRRGRASVSDDEETSERPTGWSDEQDRITVRLRLNSHTSQGDRSPVDDDNDDAVSHSDSVSSVDDIDNVSADEDVDELSDAASDYSQQTRCHRTSTSSSVSAADVATLSESDDDHNANGGDVPCRAESSSDDDDELNKSSREASRRRSSSSDADRWSRRDVKRRRSDDDDDDCQRHKLHRSH